MLLNTYWSLFAPAALKVGLISSLCGLLAATSQSYDALQLNDILKGSSSLSNTAGLLLFSSLLVIAMIRALPKLREEGMVMLVVLAVSVSLFFFPLPARLFIANIVLAAVLCGLIHLGIRKLESLMIVNTALVFLVIDILCRYFDTFYSMMNRSLFFFIGGVVLMIVGSIAEKSRQAIKGGFQS